MKRIIQIAALFCGLLQSATTCLFAQLNVQSDGSDGALNITNNTTIDLSLATNGVWSANNSINSGKGIYDSNKWAVVFKYSSVNISGGATLTFLNHGTHAPVVWLVQSNATINGVVSLNGTFRACGTYPAYLSPVEPGPGGFRAGSAGPSGVGNGYGPGGAGPAYAQVATYASTYGNPQILPLIGGSGGNGQSDPSLSYCDGTSGGGGAILIAAGGTVTVNGQITAKAIPANYHAADGAIKIIADHVLGTGTLDAAVDGRTRVEANTISQLNIFPSTSAVPPGSPPVIWASTNAPTVMVVSVNGQSAPADPLAGILTASDVNIGTNGVIDITLQTQNFPPSGAVSVRVVPKYATYFNVNASYVSGTFAQSTWKATTALPNGFCVLQAHATSP